MELKIALTGTSLFIGEPLGSALVQLSKPTPILMIAHIFLAIYLIIVGLTILFGLSLPSWIAGTMALIAGVLLLANYVGVSFNKKGN